MEAENNISRQEQLKHFLQNEVGKLEKDIKNLEDENDLQERLSAGEFSTDDLKRILVDVEESGCLKDRNLVDKSLEGKGIQLKVESLEGLTGIKFDNCKLKKLKDSTAGENTQLKWRRHLSGQCYGLKFSVDFVVIESTVEESSNVSKETPKDPQEECKARLNDLDVNVLNPLATRELQLFIEKVKKENNLCLFFQVLMQYATWCQHRQRTFEHFKSKYPHIVHLVCSKQLSTVLQMINPASPDDVFTISWQIHVGEVGNVIPQIALFTYNTKLKRQTALGKSLPLYFRKMLSVFGIEQAIELVLGMIVAGKFGHSS